MNTWLMKYSGIIFILVLFSLVGTGPAYPEPAAIMEWKVPWENTRPRDPNVDPKGRVWFCGQKGGYLAYLDPATGEFKKYDLGPGAGPHNLIIDGKGFVWFAGNLNAYIGKLDPSTGGIRKFPMPDPEAGDPHTLVFDSRGDIWFTVQHGNFIGKLTTGTGEIQLVKVNTPHARPYGIQIDSNDRPWVALFGTYKIATVDPETMALREYPLPRREARPRRIAITSNSVIWYGDYSGGMLGRFDPRTGRFQEWPLPGGRKAGPYAMAVDDSDRIWMVETGLIPNRLVGFSTAANRFFSVTGIPSGAGSVRHMVFHNPTQTIWFGEDSNYIGRARIPGAR